MKLTRQCRILLTIAAVICGTIGLSLLATSAWYGVTYLTDSPSNSYRGEYLEGVIMALTLAFPFWLGASAAIYPLRSVISRATFIIANIPAAVLGLMTLGFFIFILTKIVLPSHAA